MRCRAAAAGIGFIWLLSCCCCTVWAETVDLKIAEVKAGGQSYFTDLLRESLIAAGHEVSIEHLGRLPQKRMASMLAQGELSLLLLVESAERNRRYVPVEVDLTDGLIGHRILLIPKGGQPDYDAVKTLDDFRRLGKVGALGRGWFDVEVWKRNGLAYIERDGDWRNKIYKQIALQNRGVDYFSRGFFEVVEEADAHPYLEIEQRLMLIYERDFRFYLGKGSARYKFVLEQALRQAKRSGLMARLMRKHWGDAFKRLDFDNRVKLHLKNPGME